MRFTARSRPSFLAQAVARHLNGAERDVHERGYVLGAEAHFEVGAEAQVGGGEYRVLFRQAGEIVFVHHVEITGEFSSRRRWLMFSLMSDLIFRFACRFL